mmetsp:Transcript_29484/g.80505  ORF Transcript_29484/g.80505 Transcript_29484/m.80505 type:complete len:214 (+) Transcript_29484:723-1364(+)
MPTSSQRHRGSRSSNRAFQYSASRQAMVMRYIPNDVDVLLTHGGHGSDSLRAAINRIQPKLHACGHDHELHGATVQEFPPRRSTPAPDSEVRARWRRASESGGSGRNAGTSGRAAQLVEMSGSAVGSRDDATPVRGESSCKHTTDRRRRQGKRQRTPGLAKPKLGVHVNAAICNSKYEPVQLPVVVDLRTKRRRRAGRPLPSDAGESRRQRHR